MGLLADIHKVTISVLIMVTYAKVGRGANPNAKKNDVEHAVVMNVFWRGESKLGRGGFKGTTF